jgi:hypothetical protein
MVEKLILGRRIYMCTCISPGAIYQQAVKSKVKNRIQISYAFILPFTNLQISYAELM